MTISDAVVIHRPGWTLLRWGVTQALRLQAIPPFQGGPEPADSRKDGGL